MCGGQEQRQKVIYLAEPKQNDPRQTYLRISVSTNLQYESQGLMARNNVYKTIWKKRI